MAAGKVAQARRKNVKRPPSYYKDLRQDLAAKGRTAPKHAPNTKRSTASLLKKWNRFCSEIDESPESFLQTAVAEDFKTFLQWTLDRYPRVRASESLNNYWRVLNMHILDQSGRKLDDSIRRDVTNYKKVLVDEYQLRRLPKKRGVSSVDDLYHILFYHWVYDDTVYRDEQQRSYVATGILMASYCGCRPVSMFDTRIKFDDEDGSCKLANHPTVAGNQEDPSDDHKNQDTPNVLDWNDAQVTLVNSGSDLNNDGDASTCSDSDSNTDSDSGTDDGVDAPLDKTGSLLWRHITFIIAPHEIPGEPNLLFAKVSFIHTKGEDNCPREQALPLSQRPSETVTDLFLSRKTFIVEREDNPLLCLLDHLLSLALYDDVFAAESLWNVSNIFRAKIPLAKKCLQLKMKRSALDIPVFREPGRAVNGFRTSSTKALRSSTWLRYLTQLGRNSGLEKSFTQYCARRGLVNAINNKAPSSVRDQIFDHQSNTVRYYLNQEVRFNTVAAFLGRPSDEVVQKLARLMTLTVDPNAPTKLSPELSKKLSNSKRVVQLSRESKVLTEKLKRKYTFVGRAPPNDPCLKAKKQVDAALHREKSNRRNRMLEKARKRHFRNADTSILEAQFTDPSITASDEDIKPPAPLEYDISERDDIVRLTCQLIANMTDHGKHAQRLETLRARVALCDRQESRHRARPPSTHQLMGSITAPIGSLKAPEEDKKDHFALVCKPTQCIFCLGNERKSYLGRMFEYVTPHKMMNEVDKHLKSFTAEDEVPCPHPTCKGAGLVLPSVMVFKNHTATVHKISLRA